MALDYSGRRAASKNRPKKQSGGLFAFILIGALAVAYLAGIGTGWFVFRHSAKGPAPQSPVGAVPKGAAPAPSGGPPAAAPGGEGRGAEPALTFYETLPKGGKSVVIGTGLNPAKEAPPAPAKTGGAPQQHPPAKAAPQQVGAPPAPPAKGAETKEAAGGAREQVKADAPAQGKEAAAKKPAGGAKFCVQLASYPDRKGAEELRGKLAAKGLDAYVVESNIPEKGIRYRVRVGRRLGQTEAEELLQKVGKGAYVTVE